MASSAHIAEIARLGDRIKGALFGIFIGDALSMPVHWYYNPRDIQKEFGTIRDFLPAKDIHPSSILNLSATGTGGRGRQTGNIIGDVILHGKRPMWGIPNSHYHRGLKAGENTLNSQVARALLRCIAAKGKYDPSDFLATYVTFMTTPGATTDTYAETYHRMFFKNWAAGKAPAKCAEDDGHNVSSMGGFVLLPPVALLGAAQALLPALPAEPAASGIRYPAAAVAAAGKAAQALTVQQMYTTHNSAELEESARVYAQLLAELLAGRDLREAVTAAGTALGVDIPAVVRAAAGKPDTAVIGPVFSSACYISGSFPALLYLAYKYADSPEAALIANTNAGGENCHRGSALGAVMGAAAGTASWPARWLGGLQAKELPAEVDGLVRVALGEVPGAAAGAAAAAPVAAVGGAGAERQDL